MRFLDIVSVNKLRKVGSRLSKIIWSLVLVRLIILLTCVLKIRSITQTESKIQSGLAGDLI